MWRGPSGPPRPWLLTSQRPAQVRDTIELTPSQYMTVLCCIIPVFELIAFVPESTAKTRCCFAAHSRFQNTFSEFFSNFFSVFRKPLQLSFLSEPLGCRASECSGMRAGALGFVVKSSKRIPPTRAPVFPGLRQLRVV